MWALFNISHLPNGVALQLEKPNGLPQARSRKRPSFCSVPIAGLVFVLAVVVVVVVVAAAAAVAVAVVAAAAVAVAVAVVGWGRWG